MNFYDLYNIDAQLQSMMEVNPETGELLCDPEQLESLMMERDKLLEQLTFVAKAHDREEEVIDDEIKRLTGLKNTIVRNKSKVKDMIAHFLHGEKFKTPQVSVYTMTTKATAIDPTLTWQDFEPRFLIQKNPEISKSAIKEALENGEIVNGAQLVENNSLVIRYKKGSKE